MTIQILLLILGLVLVVVGADYLVEGSSRIARKAHLSEFLIGLTIVGIGTSTPEMVVSFFGAIQGNADIAIGNVIGSNIFNVLLILGVTALVGPIKMTKDNIHKDIPLNIFITLLLILFGMHSSMFGIGSENVLSRLGGAIFLLLFIAYMVYSFKNGMHSEAIEAEQNAQKTENKVWVAAIMVIGGLAGLILGGRLFVNAAKNIATLVGMSDKFIAITILAGGTSMPELVTCIVATLKKKGQLALGNIIGSNISNVLLILGGSALITPLSFAGISYIDIGVLFLSSLLIWGAAYTGKGRKLDRADGVVFLGCEVAYMTWLIINL